MSTSLLYHEFGIRGYEHRRMDRSGGTTVFHIEQPRHKLRCAHCGSENVTRQGSRERVFRSLPIGRRPMLVYLDVAHVRCAKCGVTRQVSVPFADGKRQHTRAFARYALDLTRHMTIKDVANHLGVGWDLVKDLKKEHLECHFRQPRLRHREAAGHRRNPRRSRIPVSHAGVRSRHRSDCVCGERQGG